MAYANDITGYVRGHSTLDVTCWNAGFGYPLGTLAWSAIVDSQATLADASAKLLGDSGYLDMIDSAADMISTGGEDHLRELIAGGEGGTGEAPPIGAVAQITTATAFVDRFADALGWGVEVAQFASEVLGSPVVVLRDLFGTMGEITWIGIQPDIAAAESAGAKLAGNADYLERMKGTGELFIHGSAHVSQLTRIA